MRGDFVPFQERHQASFRERGTFLQYLGGISFIPELPLFFRGRTTITP
jgi:hypothetical protein